MSASLEQRFVSRMRELLVNLPYDLKAVFEAMTDEDLPADARFLATGAVIYCLSPADPIPDHIGIVGFTDDVVALRLSLKALLDMGGDAISEYPTRFPEQFENLDEDLALFREYFGENMSWLERRMSLEAIHKDRYKGKTVREYVEDDEAGQYLYEEGLSFTTDYEIDDEEVERLSSGRPVFEAFQKRHQFEEGRR
ncbi:MAG: DUF1232 domain-containing protein [Myxococcales bacterium]|nr:DUF1232 domain-containing protein [Myxococcales bacterium]